MLAQVVLALHVAFLCYVVLGGFLAWWWTRAIWPHVAAVGWAALGLVVPLACPFTTWQDTLRRRGGLPELPRGFIGTYVVGPVVPAGWVPAVRVGVGVLVAISWLGAARLWKLHRARFPRSLQKP